MPTVTLQFEGICCHIAPPAGSPTTVQRRSVLPSVQNHTTYIEVYTNDVDVQANPDFTFTQAYARDNMSFKHTVVQNAKIELLNVTSTTFTPLPSFEQRVPKLRDVEPRFTAVKPALLDVQIATNTVAAYFDMTVGILSAGPPESFRTVFVPENAWPIRHLAQWVQLELEVSSTAPVLRVTDLASGTPKLLALKDGTDVITIGNQTQLDILGVPSMEGHFMHYYDLADPRPADPVPTPKIGQGLGVGCADTQWP